MNKLQKKETEIRRLKEELEAVISSPSWRMTAPIRKISGWVSKKQSKIRQWLSANRDPIRRYYFKLPLPSELKNRLADAIDNKLGNKNIEVKGRYENLAKDAVTLLQQVSGNALSCNLALPAAAEPEVSIIIPAFNNINYTLTCLKSVYDNTGPYSYEVIVVDDNSDDATRNISGKVRGLKYLKNDSNLGFIRSCNRGAEAASGEYLVFLNNDTVVIEGWLEEMIETFRSRSDAGIVGAKLIYPDGRLQEAGGMVWRDGSAWNYGHGDDPSRPEYNYLREVDYCSAACFAIPKDVFVEIGGFDTAYEPAYFEDTDIAFRVREAGKKVFYQPLSMIIHFEGATSGRDTNRGIKSYQVSNQTKFFDRWEHVLKTHGANGNFVEREKERNVKKRALIIDATTLTPDQDAGSAIVFNYMRIFMSMGYKVTFAPDTLVYLPKYTPNLQRSGIECLYTPFVESIGSHLEKTGEQYDVVFLARANIAALHIDNVKKYCLRAFVIFDTEDLQFLREMRETALRLAEKRRQQELSIMSKADLTIVTSSFEHEFLRGELPGRRIENIYPPLEMQGTRKGFDSRKDIAFIGGYQHPPNVDAVKYFVRDIFPLIKEQLEEVSFYVIGSKPPRELLDLASDDIIITGYVKQLEDYLDSVRLTVAPLRYGAGVKGKIVTSLGHGVPVVSTGIGAEGMGLVHERDLLVADGPAQFASSVVTLYADKDLWNRLSESGMKEVRTNYSLDRAREILKNYIGK